VAQERTLIYRMLKGEPWLDSRGLLHLLQCSSSRKGWLSCVKGSREPIDATLATQFRAAVHSDEALRQRLVACSERFHRYREHPPRTESEERYALVGDLRKRLASTCLHALEPDLVVLDEFQRFRHLLDGKDEAAELMRELVDRPDTRVLMLSATPYRMLALDHEKEDDHYPDFLRTLGFLYGNPEEVKATEADIQRFRRGLYSLSRGEDAEAAAARASLEARLRRVMCRTERVGMTARRDAMLTEPPQPAPLEPVDLGHVSVADQVAHALGVGDAIEYWKSSPYLLSFLRHYELRRELDKVKEAPSEELLTALQAGSDHLLDRARFERHEQVDPANARMRALFADTLDRGLWRVLWLPPAMPYAAPGGAFAEVGDVTKALVFSAWNAVPDAIAALCSYEAERRMLEGLDGEPGYGTLYDRLKPMLRFTRGRDGRLTGMPTLALVLPSPSLATRVDPLLLALERGGVSPVSREALLAAAETALEPLVTRLVSRATRQGLVDQRWYWAAPFLLDATDYPGLRTFCESRQGETTADEEADSQGERESGYETHLRYLVEAMEGSLEPPLGRPPEDLSRVLAELALAGPGTCALRALHRVAPGLSPDNPVLLAAARKVADGFRTLFNLPESIALLRGSGEDTYWRLVLGHGLDGNLQALLDEQVHVLQESLGVLDKEPSQRVTEIGTELAEALSLRTAQLRVDLVQPRPRLKRIDIDPIHLRCRFALRFGDLRDSRDATLARADTVRVAFNSPFRPFVLASTSIGQEGLDFHTWCHAVVHWNLPSNPVDLEQREGRVHRYKGHAVRKNLVRRYGLAALRAGWDRAGDPWAWMFERAARERPAGMSDLWPYWIFEVEGGAQVERRVPLLPFSREVERLRRLKRNLALYRLVFGQPRQEDLLAHLSAHMGEEQAEQVATTWTLSLQP
jgi:hypothetical protein